MSKATKFHYTNVKNKKKSFNNNYIEEEYVSIKDIKREKEHKQYRNYENALRSKNLDRLMEYEDD